MKKSAINSAYSAFRIVLSTRTERTGGGKFQVLTAAPDREPSSARSASDSKGSLEPIRLSYPMPGRCEPKTRRRSKAAMAGRAARGSPSKKTRHVSFEQPS